MVSYVLVFQIASLITGLIYKFWIYDDFLQNQYWRCFLRWFENERKHIVCGLCPLWTQCLNKNNQQTPELIRWLTVQRTHTDQINITHTPLLKTRFSTALWMFLQTKSSLCIFTKVLGLMGLPTQTQTHCYYFIHSNYVFLFTSFGLSKFLTTLLTTLTRQTLVCVVRLLTTIVVILNYKFYQWVMMIWTITYLSQMLFRCSTNTRTAMLSIGHCPNHSNQATLSSFLEVVRVCQKEVPMVIAMIFMIMVMVLLMIMMTKKHSFWW